MRCVCGRPRREKLGHMILWDSPSISVYGGVRGGRLERTEESKKRGVLHAQLACLRGTQYRESWIGADPDTCTGGDFRSRVRHSSAAARIGASKSRGDT